MSSVSEISNDKKKRIKRVIGKLLFYAQSVDSTILMAINAIAVAKKYGMRRTLDAVVQLLDYEATHLDAKVTFEKVA